MSSRESDAYDPYDQPPRPHHPARRDPFRVLSREAWPAREGRHARPVRPHARPSGRELPGPGESCAERGVWEERAPFAGLRTFVVRGDHGERLADVTAIAEIVDEAFLLGLERLLERYRPRPAMRIV